MAGTTPVSRLFSGHDSGGGLWMAQPRTGGWNSGRCARGHDCGSHHADWHPDLVNVARFVSGCDLPGADLGWGLRGPDAFEVFRSHERRLVAGTPGGVVDPHHHQVRPVPWGSGPLWCGLPGFGSFCRAALPRDIATRSNGLKRSAEATRTRRYKGQLLLAFSIALTAELPELGRVALPVDRHRRGASSL